MTHKDIYTKFMIEYDKANVTSSYPSLTEYEVATVLDKAYNALIAQKFTGNNYRRVGFEGDVKVISDLQPLIKNQNITFSESDNKVAENVVESVLPQDFLYFIGANIKSGTNKETTIYEGDGDVNIQQYNNIVSDITTALSTPNTQVVGNQPSGYSIYKKYIPEEYDLISPINITTGEFNVNNKITFSYINDDIAGLGRSLGYCAYTRLEDISDSDEQTFLARSGFRHGFVIDMEDIHLLSRMQNFINYYDIDHSENLYYNHLTLNFKLTSSTGCFTPDENLFNILLINYLELIILEESDITFPYSIEPSVLLNTKYIILKAKNTYPNSNLVDTEVHLFEPDDTRININDLSTVTTRYNFNMPSFKLNVTGNSNINNIIYSLNEGPIYIDTDGSVDSSQIKWKCITYIREYQLYADVYNYTCYYFNNISEVVDHINYLIENIILSDPSSLELEFYIQPYHNVNALGEKYLYYNVQPSYEHVRIPTEREYFEREYPLNENVMYTTAIQHIVPSEEIKTLVQEIQYISQLPSVNISEGASGVCIEPIVEFIEGTYTIKITKSAITGSVTSVPMKLVNHDVAYKFFQSAYNYPWIKIPVCYIQNNYIIAVLDPVFKSRYAIESVPITYIKKPNTFVKGLPEVSSGYASYFENSSNPNDPAYQFECNNSVAEELISLAISFALENVESQRLNSKLNMRGLES